MKVKLNGKEISLAEEKTTLETLIKAEGIKTLGVAVAVNGSLVKKADWGSKLLNDGDDILVITAVCGG